MHSCVTVPSACRVSSLPNEQPQQHQCRRTPHLVLGLGVGNFPQMCAQESQHGLVFLVELVDDGGNRPRNMSTIGVLRCKAA